MDGAAPSTPEAQRKRAPKDFDFGHEIGSGSYSTVFFAKEKPSGQEFAVKMLDKKHVMKEKKVKYVQIERDVLHRLNHPLIVKLFYTFQTANSLYFVLEYASKGDMLGMLRKAGALDVTAARFYAAEITLAVEYLHSRRVIHRDLKPEITDFGSAKILPSDHDPSAATSATTDTETAKKNSFVGTAEYCSPELLSDRAASYQSDIWAIGCILFQLLAGRPPFKGNNEYQTFQKILKLEYALPEGFDGSAGELVEQILRLDPDERPDFKKIKASACFRGVVWDGLEESEAPTVAMPSGVALVAGGNEGSDLSLEDLMIMGAELGIEPSGSSRGAGDKYPYEVEEVIPDGVVGIDLAGPEERGIALASSDSIQSDSIRLATSMPSINDGEVGGTRGAMGVDAAGATMAGETRQQALNRQRGSKLAALIDVTAELIVLAGSVKGKGLFSKRKGLLLTDRPRLLFFDEDKFLLKQEIPWSGISSVTLKV
ncbi:3-phosphoinositide dependent protein kinase-1 [Irineochytrium annulatum]|nr:3-phosphoinositide dependent protein kinase-1 [Irineochytrium annulatum]